MMRVCLTEDRRARVLSLLKDLFAESFDEELSDFRAKELLDFFVRELGPPVYNQAIQDARAFLLDKLEDLEGEVYETDEPHAR